MVFYIAGHNQEECRKIRESLRGVVEIKASWLDGSFGKTDEYSEDQRRQIAATDAAEARSCDGLILVASPYRVPGGKFVEAGVAIGCGIPVYVIGHRENMLMWHPLVIQVDSVDDLIGMLSTSTP